MTRTKKLSFILITIFMILLATVFLHIPIMIEFATSAGKKVALVSVQLLEPIIAGIYAVIIFKFFKISVRLNRKNLKMIVTLGWPVLLIGALNVTQYPKIWHVLSILPTGQIVAMASISFISGLLIGFSEEIFFRGGIYRFTTILYGKDRMAKRKSIIWNGFLFGGIHIINYLNGPQVFWDTTNQIIYAIGTGWFLATIYEISGNLWVPILLHAWVDMTDFFFGAANNFQKMGNYQSFEWTSFLLFLVMTFFAWYEFKIYRPKNEQTIS